MFADKDWEAICSMFNGFFRLDKIAYAADGTKKPLSRRADPLLKYSEYPDYDFLAGELADDIVILDFDDKNEGATAVGICWAYKFKCNVVETEKGWHIYFKNPDIRTNGLNRIMKTIPTGHVCALGLQTEYKVASKGTHAPFEPLKLGKIERRFVINDYDDRVYHADELDELPPMFYHYKERRGSLFGLKEGDGRNSVLSEFAVGLQKIMAPESVKAICHLINSAVFGEPLAERELNEVLRAETFQNKRVTAGGNTFITRDTDADKTEFYEKGYGFKHQSAAIWLIRNKHFIKINGTPHVYFNGIYTPLKLESVITDSIANLTAKDLKEIIDFMYKTDNDIPTLTLENENLYEFIGFKNGMWSNVTGELLPYDPSRVCFFKIDIDYNPNAEAVPVVDKFLNDIADNDKQLRALLEEVGGFILNPRNKHGKAFFFVGEGENGKSTFLSVLEAVFNPKNCSYVSFTQLSEHFMTADLIGKLINISGELGKKYIEETDTFKKLVTGDVVAVRQIYKSSVPFSNTAKFIFAGNNMPRANDTSAGFLRRLVFIPFLANFKNREDKDLDIIFKLKTEAAKEYFLKIFVEAYFRLQKNGFTECEKVKEMERDFTISNNPTLEFINQMKESGIEIESMTCETFYFDYGQWCLKNGYKSLSRHSFTSELKRQGYVSKVKYDKNTQKGARHYVFESD